MKNHRKDDPKQRKQKLNNDSREIFKNLPKKILIAKEDRKTIEDFDKKGEYLLSFLKIINLFLLRDTVLKFKLYLVSELLKKSNSLSIYQDIDLSALNTQNDYQFNEVIKSSLKNHAYSSNILEVFYNNIKFVCHSDSEKLEYRNLVEKVVGVFKVFLERKHIRNESDFKLFSNFFNNIEKELVKINDSSNVFYRICLMLKRISAPVKDHFESIYPQVNKKKEKLIEIKSKLSSPPVVDSLALKDIKVQIIPIEQTEEISRELESLAELEKLELLKEPELLDEMEQLQDLEQLEEVEISENAGELEQLDSKENLKELTEFEEDLEYVNNDISEDLQFLSISEVSDNNGNNFKLFSPLFRYRGSFSFFNNRFF